VKTNRAIFPDLLTIFVLLFASRAAEAHVVHGEAAGFGIGFLHPLSGLDHMIAMICVGMWGAQLGAPAIWVLPVAFPMMMAFGGFLGLVGVHLPFGEICIALSGIFLGFAVLTEIRAPLWSTAIVVGFFGLFHGYAHGAELPPGHNALLYSLGFVAATGILHATGIVIGLVYRWAWGRTALRVAGACVLVGGTFFLRQALA